MARAPRSTGSTAERRRSLRSSREESGVIVSVPYAAPSQPWQGQPGSPMRSIPGSQDFSWQLQRFQVCGLGLYRNPPPRAKGTTMPDFVHLHCHSEYSLLDGAIRVKDLCTRAKDLGMPAVALTDHGNMHGALIFRQKALD
ncbi:MAG: hypothetical protein C0405_12615, partial [Desulfovibrio sp.]|nr:hypothetical protein [Desulfovibrio sp.]